MPRCLIIFIGLLLIPHPAAAWGFDAHKFIMDRAIALLPAELRPLFEQNRAAVVEHAIDPDTWIIAGWEDERPRHFLDLDSDGFGPYPFNDLPRDYTAALAKFGAGKMRDAGTLPWRVEEIYGGLQRAFEAYARRGAFGRNDIILFSAWLAHYTADAHVPLHGVTNYDGQLSKQWGVHSRWESTMFERFRNQLIVTPKPIPPVKQPREFIFTALLQDTQLVPGLLKADHDAIGERDVYDDVYYQTFFANTRTVMERRLNDSIAAVAGMIAGAWEAAGQPAIALSPSPSPQRRRRN
jgi:Zinc dependent phospholipase C